MTENMKHWDALKTTDPKYTKLVTFGRKFTSINSQWQLQRMTEQFGPIGKGWGYTVEHDVQRLHDWYTLAVADVTIWWRDSADDKVATYGPVRGTAPVLEPARDKGRLVYEADGATVKLHLDDDAGKKAMTDALTKGLSHLGLSADVFLGLFDDNKYVREVAQQFANPPPSNGNSGTPLAPDAPFAGNTLEQAHKEISETNGGEARSQYQMDKIKNARAAGWIVVNKTAKGQKDQVYDYLDIAENPDDIAAILNHNTQVIANSGEKEKIEAAADELLRWMEKAAAPVLQ